MCASNRLHDKHTTPAQVIVNPGGIIAQPPTPPPFDRLRSRAELLDAYGPLVDDFAACLELVADLDPQDAEAALCTRMVTYLDCLADALGTAVPAARRAA